MNNRHKLTLISSSLILAMALAACNDPALRPTSTPKPISEPQPAVQEATSAPAIIQAAAPSGPVLGMLEFTGIDIGFTPNFANVDKPGRYTVKFHNTGAIPHDISFPDGTKITAKANETQQADVMIGAEGVKFICSVPGHKDAGMVGTVSVGGKAVADTEEAGGGHGGPAVAYDVQPDANAPAYKLHDALAPLPLGGTDT